MSKIGLLVISVLLSLLLVVSVSALCWNPLNAFCLFESNPDKVYGVGDFVSIDNINALCPVGTGDCPVIVTVHNPLS